MPPQTPPDRRAFDSPDIGATAPPAERNASTKRARSSLLLPMLVAALVIAAIIAVIILV